MVMRETEIMNVSLAMGVLTLVSIAGPGRTPADSKNRAARRIRLGGCSNWTPRSPGTARVEEGFGNDR